MNRIFSSKKKNKMDKIRNDPVFGVEFFVCFVFQKYTHSLSDGNGKEDQNFVVKYINVIKKHLKIAICFTQILFIVKSTLFP